MASGQKPGESDRDYLRRLAAEEAALRRARNAEADAKVERDRAAAAARGEFPDDDDFLRQFQSDLGVSINDWRDGLDYNSPDLIGVDDAIKEIRKAKKRGNDSKARRIYRRNKKQLKAAAVEQQKQKGWLDCAVVAVLLLAGFGTGGFFLVDGAVELVTAMVR